MLATSSQHARYKLVTSLATCTLCQGRREGVQCGKVFATWEKVFATWKKCSQHDVWMLVATCSPQARNMFATNSQHRSQHVHYVRGEGGGTTLKKCSQHGKRCSQHSQHALQHHDPTADMFHDSNRVTRKVSDASARIRRPGVSSSVIINIRRDMNIVHSTRVASWSLVEMIIIPLSIYIYHKLVSSKMN
jgi:hypothetical protein